MHKAEEVLKTLDLDYSKIGSNGYRIKPKDFNFQAEIVLVVVEAGKLEMFIWDEDETMKELVQFQIEENIPDIYSYLYQYKLNKCDKKIKQ